MVKHRWLLFAAILISGVFGLRVRVSGPHYAGLGTSILLTCEHSVPSDHLHKVDWLKGGFKFLSYVQGRTPPFRKFDINGAIIDLEGSSDHEVVLSELGTAASGLYACEVSTDTPIFSKASDYHELVIIQSQMEEPRISFGKYVYTVGEWVRANCTSGRATPTPHVTWFINGTQASPELVRVYRTNGRIGRAELQLRLLPEHTPGLQLTCLATIPAYPRDKYADRRAYTISVEVLPAEPHSDVQKSIAMRPSSLDFRLLFTALLLVEATRVLKRY